MEENNINLNENIKNNKEINNFSTENKVIYDVFIYARVSTNDKDQDPEHQLHPLHLWAERMHYSYLDFVDYESGRTVEKRTQFKKMFKMLDQTKGIAIIDKDRFSRDVNLEEGMHYANLLRKANKFIYIGNDNRILDQNTPQDEWITYLQLSFLFASLESIKIGERVKRAYENMKAKAEAQGKKLNWGRKSLTMKTIKKDENNNPIIRPDGSYEYIYVPLPVDKIKSLQKKGYSIRQIAEEIGCSIYPVWKVINNKYEEQIKKEEEYLKNKKEETEKDKRWHDRYGPY
ncbi:MAG: recombinase family protein [Candidatus Micrarchaeia archaeon]|uniref:recombinase family protein n=1 Tax=Caldisericum sp. TaxID=2499687 RepID=UPI003D0EAFC1